MTNNTHGFDLGIDEVGDGDGKERLSRGRTKSGKAAGGSRLVTRRASEIVPEPVDWIWRGRIARGKITVLAGDPGVGKSQLSCDIIARITSVIAWPDGSIPTIGSALIFSAEDGAEDTIVPRLLAAGADPYRVRITAMVKQEGKHDRTFNLHDDLPLLDKELEADPDIDVVVIDPIAGYLGNTDSHQNAAVRAVLEPLAELASRRNVAIVAIAHLSKATGQRVMTRVNGSIGFVAVARVVLIAAVDPEGGSQRYLAVAKCNLSRPAATLTYHVDEGSIGNGLTAPFLVWDGTDPRTADQLFGDDAPSKSSPALDTAEEFLEDFLQDGPRSQADVKSAAEEAGISIATLRRAKDELGIVTRKLGMVDGWQWRLPGQDADGEDAHGDE